MSAKEGSAGEGSFRFKTLEIEAVSDVDFADATDRAIALASQMIPDLTWFQVVQLGGRIAQGKRVAYRIAFQVGTSPRDRR